MKKFQDWILLKEDLDYNSAKKIVFNAIKADPKSEDDVLGSKISVFDDKDQILKASALKQLPNYDDIITAVSKQANKTTVNQLIGIIVASKES